MESEKLCLQWKDFRSNLNQAFTNLRKDIDFNDVTLACEDGSQVEAHKVVLAASSPIFQNLLKKNKHSHPLIYMRGVKHHDLLAIVDFLYCGEANVFQENLDSFLVIAGEIGRSRSFSCNRARKFNHIYCKRYHEGFTQN